MLSASQHCVWRSFDLLDVPRFVQLQKCVAISIQIPLYKIFLRAVLISVTNVIKLISGAINQKQSQKAVYFPLELL